MERKQPAKPEGDVALSADHHEERAGKKRKKKDSKKPGPELKAADKKQAKSKEPKTLLETWEELIDKKYTGEKTKPREHKKEEPESPGAEDKRGGREYEESESLELEEVEETVVATDAEGSEIFLDQIVDVEIPLHGEPLAEEPEQKSSIDEKPSNPQSSHHAIRPEPTTLTESIDQVLNPHTESASETVIESSQEKPETAPAPEQTATDLSIDEINSQIQEAYATNNPIDTTEAGGAYGGGGPAAKPEQHSWGKSHPARTPQERRDYNQIKKLKKEERRQDEKIHELEDEQERLGKELDAAKARNHTNEDYWRKKLAAQRPPAFETKASAPKVEASRPVDAKKPEMPKFTPKPPEKLSKEIEDLTEDMRLPPEHRLERSAWHSIEVDKNTGRAVEQPTALDYGEAFKREQRQEALARSEPDDRTVASGQLAVGTITDLGSQLSGSKSDNGSEIKQKPSPANAVESTIRMGRDMATSNSFWLWLILGIIIIAIIAALNW